MSTSMARQAPGRMWIPPIATSTVQQTLAQGSDTVHINGMPAARVGDRTVCDGKISVGSTNVNIGGGTETTDDIDPEVPVLLERAILGLGVASAFVLASP